MARAVFSALNQASPLQNFHREEIRSRQHAHMCRQKISPRHRAAVLASRCNAMSAQNIANGLIRNRVPQVGQGADDTVVAPAGVLPRNAHDQSFKLFIDRRSSRISAVVGAIELLRDQLSVPSAARYSFARAVPGSLSRSHRPTAAPICCSASPVYLTRKSSVRISHTQSWYGQQSLF